MKLSYDREADVLTIVLRQGDYSESDEVRPGVVFDYDAHGQLLRIELLYASRQNIDLESLSLDRIPAK